MMLFAWLLDSLGIILIFFLLGLIPSKWVRIGLPALLVFSFYGTLSHGGWQWQDGYTDTMLVPLLSFTLGVIAIEAWRRKRKASQSEDAAAN